MVASSLATLEQDIAKHKIKNSHIFVINNTNSTMYGLTYGQFSTFSDAQKAIANLPVGLQKRGIFAKEIAKIQQQITANN
jgi:septal ring-binding cell division protein DamX